MVRKEARGIRVILAAFIACVFGMVTFASAPFASAADGNIDPNRKGSISIHKYEKNTDLWANTANDGTEKTAPNGAKALSGVQFTLYRVDGLDLSQPAKWAGLDSATAAGTSTATVNGAQYNLVKHAEKVTDAAGLARFADLPVGFYYVVESSVGSQPISQKAQPFFVSLPFGQAGKTWNYDVHTYPKNVLNPKGEKTADTSATRKVGDVITWDMKQTVPASDNGYSKFGLVDVLAKTLALDVENNADPKGAVTVTVNGTALAADKILVEKKAPTASGKVPVQVSLVADANGKISYIKAGDEVIIKIRTKVVSMPDNGEVTNGFFPIANDYDPFNHPSVPPVDPNNPNPPVDPNNPPLDPDNPPVVAQDTPKFGSYAFKKVGDSTPAQALAGAVFEIKDGDTVVAEATSDANGIVHFEGIFLGKSAKGDTSLTKDFKIVEKTAPAGYKLLTTPLNVTLKIGKIDINDATKLGANVVNTKSNMPNLPLTGAAGKLIMTLAGAALLAIAGGLVMTNRAKRIKNAE